MRCDESHKTMTWDDACTILFVNGLCMKSTFWLYMASYNTQACISIKTMYIATTTRTLQCLLVM